MARGQDDPDPEDGKVLSPKELDISDDEHVAEIDDGRYVVSPNDPIGDVAGTADGASGGSSRRLPDGEADAGDPIAADPASSHAGSEPPDAVEITESDVRAWLTDQFAETDSRYGFDVTATFDGSVEQRQMVSNDVVTIFESLVLWYAQQIDAKTPVEEVLGILLMEANVPVRLPPASMKRLLESTDLSPEDSIADLVEAVSDDEGFRL